MLKIWSPYGATCISCKFGHKVAPLASISILLIAQTQGKLWYPAFK